MTKYLLIGGGILLIAAAAAIWWYIGDPKWVAGLIGAATYAAIQAARPFVWKLLKPMDFTPEQTEMIRQGLDPFQDPRKHDEKH